MQPQVAVDGSTLITIILIGSISASIVLSGFSGKPEPTPAPVRATRRIRTIAP